MSTPSPSRLSTWPLHPPLRSSSSPPLYFSSPLLHASSPLRFSSPPLFSVPHPPTLLLQASSDKSHLHAASPFVLSTPLSPPLLSTAAHTPRAPLLCTPPLCSASNTPSLLSTLLHSSYTTQFRCAFLPLLFKNSYSLPHPRSALLLFASLLQPSSPLLCKPPTHPLLPSSPTLLSAFLHTHTLPTPLIYFTFPLHPAYLPIRPALASFAFAFLRSLHPPHLFPHPILSPLTPSDPPLPPVASPALLPLRPTNPRLID